MCKPMGKPTRPYSSVPLASNSRSKGQCCPKLKGFPLNSLSITYEPGYPELGGHTVHFKMKQVHYQAKKPLDRTSHDSN